MARMHSGKHGKAGSKRPIKRTVPSWLTYKPAEVELLIAKYAKEGKKTSQIGAILRDKYGIPDVKPLLEKTITQVLKEKKLDGELPEDLTALIRHSAAIRKHLEDNHHDMTAKRGLQLTESKIKRLAKYYKGTGRLPEDWKFDVKRVGFYLE